MSETLEELEREEKALDDEAEKREAEAAQAENEAEEISADVYTHVFDRPFSYAGKTYDKLTFRFSEMTGKDVLAVARELRSLGINPVMRTFDVEYQYRYAARCCEEKIGSDVLEALPGKDFDRICNRVLGFLTASAS